MLNNGSHSQLTLGFSFLYNLSILVLRGRFGAKCDDLKLNGNEENVNWFVDQEKLSKNNAFITLRLNFMADWLPFLPSSSEINNGL